MLIGQTGKCIFWRRWKKNWLQKAGNYVLLGFEECHILVPHYIYLAINCYVSTTILLAALYSCVFSNLFGLVVVPDYFFKKNCRIMLPIASGVTTPSFQ